MKSDPVVRAVNLRFEDEHRKAAKFLQARQDALVKFTRKVNNMLFTLEKNILEVQGVF